MRGEELIHALQNSFKVDSDKELCELLGTTPMTLFNWRKREITPRMVARLVNSVCKAAPQKAYKDALRPIVEFYPTEKAETKQGSSFEIFSCKPDGNEHPYFSSLRDELDENHGVYLFFDSRGRAIYAGKARRQSLWKEINLAFNRDRRRVQKIKKVDHPHRKQAYRSSDEKARQIVQRPVPLHELAAYFGAYCVKNELIDEIEALLVRSFANDLLNLKMEWFNSRRK